MLLSYIRNKGNEISLFFVFFRDRFGGKTGRKPLFLGKNQKKCNFLKKNSQNICSVIEKPYLCSVKNKESGWQKEIGLWCNGNTTDSGPVFPGSSPGSPTSKQFLFRSCFFFALPVCSRPPHSRYSMAQSIKHGDKFSSLS